MKPSTETILMALGLNFAPTVNSSCTIALFTISVKTFKSGQGFFWKAIRINLKFKVNFRPQIAKANRGGRSYKDTAVIDIEYVNIEYILNTVKSK